MCLREPYRPVREVSSSDHGQDPVTGKLVGHGPFVADVDRGKLSKDQVGLATLRDASSGQFMRDQRLDLEALVADAVSRIDRLEVRHVRDCNTDQDVPHSEFKLLHCRTRDFGRDRSSRLNRIPRLVPPSTAISSDRETARQPR